MYNTSGINVVLQEGQRVSFELKSEESGRCVRVRGGEV
jgi:hypothetical protein